MKFTILILLLVSVLFSFLNGCGDKEVVVIVKEVPPPSETLELTTSEELTVDTAGEITGIMSHVDWIIVSNPFEIQIYDDKENKLRALLSGHTGTVQSIALSEDRGGDFFIAAGCSDGTIRVWDADKLISEINNSDKILIFTKQSTEYYQDMNKQPSGIQTLAFSHKGSEFLASGDEGRDIKLWNIQRFWDEGVEAAPSDSCESVRSHTSTITALTFSNDDSYFASGSRDKKIQIWDAGDCRSIKTYSNDRGEITALIFLPIDQFLDMEGNFLVGGRTDSTIVLWQVKEGRDEAEDNVKEFILDDGQEVTALTFLKDRNLLVAGTNKSNIYAWDITNIDPEGKPSWRFQESHQSSITALASLQEGTVLASGSEDGTISILRPDETLSLPQQ